MTIGLAPDTLVSTNHGVIPIRCINTSHKVKSFGGYKKIKKVQQYFECPVVALENSNDIPLVGGTKTKVLGKESFCQLKRVNFNFLITSDSFADLLSMDTDSFSLVHYADIKNDTKKKDALFEMLGCLLFSDIREEKIFLKSQNQIESFYQATVDFGYPAEAVPLKNGTIFYYGHIPKLCSIFERYGLDESFDNMVQDLVLCASKSSKIAFLKTFLMWFVLYNTNQKLLINNYLLRRQIQVLFNEFGIRSTITKDKLRLIIPVDANQKLNKSSFTTPIISLEKNGVSDLIELTVEGSSPYLANTFLVKT